MLMVNKARHNSILEGNSYELHGGAYGKTDHHKQDYSSKL